MMATDETAREILDRAFELLGGGRAHSPNEWDGYDITDTAHAGHAVRITVDGRPRRTTPTAPIGHQVGVALLDRWGLQLSAAKFTAMPVDVIARVVAELVRPSIIRDGDITWYRHGNGYVTIPED